MTGASPRKHGDRIHNRALRMPHLPTIAQTFRSAGYQAFAVGKLHVFPPRDRIGFDDVILSEEGRGWLGTVDDYEIYLADEGFVGEQFAHGMSNNDYLHRPWHLPEQLHPTRWAAREMSRMIRRRDPTRPGFWYLSFQHPHPPLTPLESYLAAYRASEPPPALSGDWSEPGAELPYPVRLAKRHWEVHSGVGRAQTLRAFYALCTHIDHQIRTVLGTLREEGILDQTIILFTADHGDMLGDHGLWAKRVFYESSARVPLLFLGPREGPRLGLDPVDDRLATIQDVMPTLLDAAGIPIPASVDGSSLLSDRRRFHLYGEYGERLDATRMIRTERFKLIYYAAGDYYQLFDLIEDPGETKNLINVPGYESDLRDLVNLLRNEAYGSDLDWWNGSDLLGLPEPSRDEPTDNRGLSSMRGIHWPPPGGQMS